MPHVLQVIISLAVPEQVPVLWHQLSLQVTIKGFRFTASQWKHFWHAVVHMVLVKTLVAVLLHLCSWLMCKCKGAKERPDRRLDKTPHS